MAAYRNIYQFSIVSQNGDDVDIFISKKNYAGVCYQRSLGRAPMLKRERNGNILGTSLEIYAECKVDGEFSHLYTSSADEFRVEVYRNQVLQWTGFVSPELYSEPDIAPPYDVQIIATDGLGELKNYDFAAYDRPKSYQAYIESILEYTGLALAVEVISDLQYYDEGWSDANSLESIVVDLSHKAGENCYDVLRAMLTSVNACITQQDGSWTIIRESDLYSWRDTVGSVEFGSMNSCDWWPVGNLNADIIPAKKYLSLTSENHYKFTVLQNSSMASDEGWTKEYNAAYDETERAYILPDGGSNIRQTVNFFTEVGYRLFLHISARNVGDAAESQKLGVMIKINGRTYQVGDEFWLKELADYEGRYAWSNTEGYLEFELPGPSDSETRADASEIEVVIPLYKYDSRSYAYATSLEVTIFNISGIHDIYVYKCFLQQDEQPLGHKVEAVIANDARESMGDIELALNDGTYAQPAADIFRNAIPIAYNSEAIIQKWKTPAVGEGSYLSVMAKDYAMQVALPRMRYRGKLNVPSMADPVIPIIFERDSTYYFLNTYSYDLLHDELEVELVSIPNASVTIESETVTELPSTGSASGSGSGSSGGGGTSGGGGGGSSTLAGLSDVQVGDAQNGQALVYENGYWVPRTVSGGGALTSDAIISALGYTPFDSDAFTKANIKNALGIKDWALASTKPSYTWTEIISRPTALSAFTNDLDLGSLAYKSSLVASDIPSLPWSKINSGKPTTLSGYGITDALFYSDDINLDSAHRHIGYGYTSLGWKTVGPAAVFGTALYNLRMQCAIGATDTPLLYISQMYNGEAKGWAELVTYEGAAGKDFEALRYKIGGTYVLNRSGNDTFVNYGNRTDGDLYLYGKNLRFSIDGGSSHSLKILNDGSLLIHDIALTKGTSNALKAGAYEALNYFADGKLIMHRNAGVENFFLNYGGAAEPMYLYGSTYSFHIGASRERAFTIFSNKDASFAANLTVAGTMFSKNFPQGKNFYQDPTSSFISTMFDADAVDDSVFRMRVVRTGTGYDGICSPDSTMLVVKSTDTHGFISFGYNDAGRTRCYIGGGNADKINWSGILFHDNMDLIPRLGNNYSLGDTTHRWKEVHAVSIKIGDATLTWDATAGMLKIDKGVYSEGAITAKKKA